MQETEANNLVKLSCQVEAVRHGRAWSRGCCCAVSLFAKRGRSWQMAMQMNKAIRNRTMTKAMGQVVRGMDMALKASTPESVSARCCSRIRTVSDQADGCGADGEGDAGVR